MKTAQHISGTRRGQTRGKPRAVIFSGGSYGPTARPARNPLCPTRGGCHHQTNASIISMKNFSLLIALTVGLFTVSDLQAQTTTTTDSTTRTRRTRTTTATISARNNARLNAQRAAVVRASNTTTIAPARVDGSLVRTFKAVRYGNPLQMVNPDAPAEYGNGRDVTRHEVDDPDQRPQGLKLFAFEF